MSEQSGPIMSALDLDALEAACRDCAAARALKEEADIAWLAHEKQRPRNLRHVTPEEQALAGATLDAGYIFDAALDGIAVDEVTLLALITRLRAAEARTAWQPIASVPIGETVMLWTPVRRIHVGHVTTLAWCEYTAWAPLPAAPEAP